MDADVNAVACLVKLIWEVMAWRWLGVDVGAEVALSGGSAIAWESLERLGGWQCLGICLVVIEQWLGRVVWRWLGHHFNVYGANFNFYSATFEGPL